VSKFGTYQLVTIGLSALELFYLRSIAVPITHDTKEGHLYVDIHLYIAGVDARHSWTAQSSAAQKASIMMPCLSFFISY
jgi:hypothetical protein